MDCKCCNDSGRLASSPSDLCIVLFGSFDKTRMMNNADRTNVIYGGWNPEVTNVFFTQGQLDPWRAMGIQQDLNDQSPAVVIPGTYMRERVLIHSREFNAMKFKLSCFCLFQELPTVPI